MHRQGSRFALIIFTIAVILSCSLVAWGEDPIAPSVAPQETVAPASQGYTAEAYAGLSDAAKRDVYFNTPELLPAGFTPEAYMSVLYPEPPAEVQP